MNEHDCIRLRHMLEAAREAISFVAGKGRADLDENRMLLLSVVKELEIIGEAAARVSTEAKAQCAVLPWPRIVAMRNRLIHGYADVNRDIVWQTVQDALPPLVHVLEKLLGDPACPE
ncbi:MAG: DUF86 domain-containing protein [Acidobacteria bacterium]|nr:DUF86 domain-containing protein [Acidobacteriota bacterium]